MSMKPCRLLRLLAALGLGLIALLMASVPPAEERYQDHAGYVAVVQAVADRMTRERFLLPEDAARLVREADASVVLR